MQYKPTEQGSGIVFLPDEERDQQQLTVLEEPTYAIVEQNLHRHHFASLSSHSTAKDKKISEVTEQGRDEKGVAFTRSWKVIGGIEYGYPNWLDEKVLMALIDAGRRRSFPVQNPIQVRINELCRMVDMDPDSGRNREKIRTSLKRIRDATIEAKGALYYKLHKAHISDRFSVLQRVLFAGETLDDGTNATCTLVWLSDKILDNINASYLMPVDTRFFMRLKPTAGRLYQLLVTRFFGLLMNIKRKEGSREGVYVVETYQDLCRRMPLESQDYQSRAKQQFYSAHKQLLNAHFLSKVEWLPNNEIRYYPGLKATYDFDNAWLEITRQLPLGLDSNGTALSGEPITLEIEGPRKAQNAAVTLELLPDVLGPIKAPEHVSDEQVAAYTKELRGRGVTVRQARDVIAQFSGDEMTWKSRAYPIIDFYVQFFDWMLTTNQPKKPESGAWLVSAIREGWLPPLSFMTREEIEEATKVQAIAATRMHRAEQDRKEVADREQYFDWLKKTPEKRWSGFLFEMEFKREHKRAPTAQEFQEARTSYLAEPETPEAYQMRFFGEIKYPLTPEEATS